jgi:Flp pilus assembly secretin CpaC
MNNIVNVITVNNMQQITCKLKMVECDSNVIKLNSSHNGWEWKRIRVFSSARVISPLDFPTLQNANQLIIKLNLQVQKEI